MGLFSRSKAPLDRRALARIGEEAAARLLTSQGYRLLERNYRGIGGEVDIIARQAQELVFIEVKARTDDSFGTPAQAVGRTKQRTIINLAQGYIAQRVKREVRWRVDIVEVWLTREGKVIKTNIIPGAFRPGS